MKYVVAVLFYSLVIGGGVSLGIALNGLKLALG